ncbi:MAG: proline--tRNA ligase [Simkaniaceae bacterium]|nr:proline--tRNA ligase [Simkaniaceae bacterium]
MKKRAITPTREEDFPNWYQEVIKAAQLAEHSPVRGCMVIKPWGYSIWENMQALMNSEFRKRGVENAYFPLFIPLSYFEKEAEHVEGFATECAVVTHHRLKKNSEGGLDPDGELEEPLVVRPTSEMIIGETFSKWIDSYRDLPLKINQWANVVRWEMRTRLFLRSAEFLWQEGHTAHATAEEAMETAREMLDVYETFAREVLAIATIPGEKSEAERFPGAVNTFTFEALMQDCKALQCGTSHYFGQRFAKASNIEFQSAEGGSQFCYTTSWGSTTRLIGAMVMTHGDDDGMILPPRVAGKQVVIIPIVHKEEMRAKVMDYCERLKEELDATVHIDTRDMRGGEKSWDWIKKGVPIRIEVGPREVDEDKVCLCMRTKEHKDKAFPTRSELVANISNYLDEIQQTLLDRSEKHLKENTHRILEQKDFDALFAGKGGFALCPWGGDRTLEEKIQKERGLTIRCLPFAHQGEKAKCFFTGSETTTWAVFSKAY